jgi:hypothetical protein
VSQASWKVYPIRGKMCGRTLRSSSWRSAAETLTLDRYTRHIVAIQLQVGVNVVCDLSVDLRTQYVMSAALISNHQACSHVPPYLLLRTVCKVSSLL